MPTETDVSDTILAKSDQLNSDDLVAGPITVTITDVKRASGEDQPIVIHISGGYKPFKPCKTVRRILVFAWGKNSKQWVGRTLVLVRDPKVKWAGEEVGGIRVQAISHIKERIEMSLAISKGKKQKVVVEKLELTSNNQVPSYNPDLSEPFLAMKNRWKSRREDSGLEVDADTFRAWVHEATDGVIAAANALDPTRHTRESIKQCEDVIRKTMPEPV